MFLFSLILSLAACGDETYDAQGMGATAEGKGGDRDGDGFNGEAYGGDDCDDSDASINPGATEMCDDMDNDCDGDVDDEDSSSIGRWWGPDFDEDGYVDSVGEVTLCDVHTLDEPVEKTGGNSDLLDYWIEVPEYQYGSDGSLVDADCDDDDVMTYPGATEVCDGMDNDCNGTADDGSGAPSRWYADSDDDGYGTSVLVMDSCSMPEGYVDNDDDCDDADASVSPDAEEMCDGVDNDCDGSVDGTDAGDLTTWYLDLDSDSYGDGETYEACDAPPGYVDVNGDCDDMDAAVNPGAEEVCDSVDNDCNTMVDDGSGAPTTWYRDADGDLYGDSVRSFVSCDEPSGYTGNSADCDDSDADVSPGATEAYNGIDDDCDSYVDEGVTCTARVYILNDMGDADTISATMTGGVFDGWWWDNTAGMSMVAGVTTVESSLGGMYREYESVLDMCFIADVTELRLWGEFATGNLCEMGGTGALIDAYEDGVLLDVTEVDYDSDSDGTNDACYYSVTE